MHQHEQTPDSNRREWIVPELKTESASSTAFLSGTASDGVNSTGGTSTV